ncbi:MAG TPA: ABC transporter ATP-binding protein [Gemmatimonadales bacterium]|nr:ABC transporter ATP-binding protein [Gemmatimonadales bacterium]
MSALLEARALRKSYLGGDGRPIDVLLACDLSVSRGEFVAVTGASGTGKSTLLHLLGALDRPTAGTVALDGIDYAACSAEALAALRNRKIGFVFQFHHLLRDFSALENVMLPQLIAGISPADAARRGEELLTAVGLAARMTHRPGKLSGGEQQRVAVARALANSPALLLADEPSGNLDAGNAEHLHGLFAELSRRYEAAVVVVTHNRSLAERADRVLSLEEGRLVPEAREGAVAG